jgi:hypothetical protein
MSIESKIKHIRVFDPTLGDFVTIEQDTQGKNRFFVDSILKGQQLAEQGLIFLSIINDLNLGTGADEKDIFLLKNPVSSGVRVELKEFIVATPKVSGGTYVRFYRGPTVTADGTALTERNKKSDSITGQAQTFQLPTISARGNLLGVYGAGGAGELAHFEDYELVIGEGEFMLLTLEQPSSNSSYSVNVVWAEIDI